MSMHKIACSTVQKRYFNVRSCCFSVDLFLCKVVNWLSSLSALYIVELSPPCGVKLMTPLYPQRETNYLWILVRTKPFHSLRGTVDKLKPPCMETTATSSTTPPRAAPATTVDPLPGPAGDHQRHDREQPRPSHPGQPPARTAGIPSGRHPSRGSGYDGAAGQQDGDPPGPDRAGRDGYVNASGSQFWGRSPVAGQQHGLRSGGGWRTCDTPTAATA